MSQGSHTFVGRTLVEKAKGLDVDLGAPKSDPRCRTYRQCLGNYKRLGVVRLRYRHAETGATEAEPVLRLYPQRPLAREWQVPSQSFSGRLPNPPAELNISSRCGPAGAQGHQTSSLKTADRKACR